MAIDDKYDAVDKAHPEQKPYLPEDLASLAVRLVLRSAVTDVLGRVFERLDRNAQQARAAATLGLLIEDVKDLQVKTVTKRDLNDLQEAIQLAVRNDATQFNDKKRERYIKIIGNALREERQIDDLASYIRDVEQLGERDFIALRVLNKVMNRTGDWQGPEQTIHPNVFIQRHLELAEKIFEALGRKRGPKRFSREEGYDACNRLQAFGLAHEIELSPRQVPVGDYSFRPSLRGLTLLKLVGDEVANWDRYDPDK